MKKWIILIRNPYNDTVQGIVDAEDDDCTNGMLKTYNSEEEAEKATKDIRICESWPYSIVEAP